MIFGSVSVLFEPLEIIIIHRYYVAKRDRNKRGEKTLGMKKTQFLIIRVNKNGNLFFPLP